MEAEQQPFEAARTMMLENLERVGFATQTYIDMVERTLRLFPGANQEQIRTSGNTLSGKLQPTETSWKGFCVRGIFKRPSAFKSNTFSLS
jgi:hypothetical protein